MPVLSCKWANSRFFAGVILFLGVLFFSLLPPLLSGLPMKRLLSSDAEFYAHSMRLLHEGVSAADAGIPMDTKPLGDRLLNQAVGALAQAAGWDIGGVSVALSIAVYAGFVLAVYWAALATLSAAGSLLVAVGCLLPVHVLGGTTFGVYPMGLLPRDLALVLAVLILGGYFRVAGQKNQRGKLFVFFWCGLAANYYSICFVHLCLVLGLAEVWREGKFNSRVLLYGLVWTLAALPALADLLAKTGKWAPVDLELMRLRNGWMIASTDDLVALVRYLRRFLVHGAMVFAGWAVLSRAGSLENRSRAEAVYRVAWLSFAVSCAALVLEANTEYLRFFFSRASLFLTLCSMVLVVRACEALVSRGAKGVPLVAGTLALFVFQSNLPSMARYFQDLYVNREPRRQFFEAVDVAVPKLPPGAVVLVPSPEMNDLAASFRTYANRKIYTSYKDGGVSLVDGDRAREWWRKYRKQEDALKHVSADALLELVRTEGISHGLLPKTHALAETLRRSAGVSVVAETAAFVLYGFGV